MNIDRWWTLHCSFYSHNIENIAAILFVLVVQTHFRFHPGVLVAARLFTTEPSIEFNILVGHGCKGFFIVFKLIRVQY